MDDLLGWLNEHLAAVEVGLTLRGHRMPPAPADHLELLEARLVERCLPRDFVQFLRWSNGLVWAPSGSDAPRHAMQATELFVQGTSNLVRGRQGQLAECIFKTDFPLEFANVLMVGESGRHQLGLMLPQTPSDASEVILFDAFPGPSSFKTRKGFTVIAGSWANFLERLRFCIQNDLRLNLPAPSPLEWAFIREQEGAGFAPPVESQYSFKRPKSFPRHWRVQDPRHFQERYAALMLDTAAIRHVQ